MNKKTAVKDISPIIASVGIYALFLVYPFIMNKGYHDITVTRYTVFCFISSVAAALCFLVRICSAETFSLKSFRFSPTDVSVFFFLVVSAISSSLSEFPLAALYGDAGRYMGFIMCAAMCAVYFWISSYYRINEKDFRIFGLSFLVITVFSFLQFKGLDLFGLFSSLAFDSRINFLSPFGNINVFSGYICIMAPFFMYMSIFAREKKQRIFYTVLSLFGFLALFIANSDSGYLGIGAAFVVLLIIAVKKTEAFFRLWCLIAEFFAVALVFDVTNRLFPGTRGLSVMTQAITDMRVSAAGIVFSFFICAVLFLMIKKDRRLPEKSAVVFICIFALVAVSVAGLIVYFSVFNVTYELGYFEKFLRFNDAWGTDRGFIWIRLIKIFEEAPLKNKLFGFGPDTVSLLMVRDFKADMLSLGYFTDNAHNEYLHILINHGLFGLFFYLSAVFLALRRTIREKNSLIISALLLPLVSWSVQAAVNITQPISTPFIFIFIALTQCEVSDHSLLTKFNIKRLFGAKTDLSGKEEIKL